MLRSAELAYPRRKQQPKKLLPEQVRLAAVLQERELVHQAAAQGPYYIGVPNVARSAQLLGLSATTAPWSVDGLLDAIGTLATLPYEAGLAPDFDPGSVKTPSRRALSEARSTYYAADGQAELPLGQIATPLLLYRNYARALSAKLVDTAFGGGEGGGVAKAAGLLELAKASLTASNGYVQLGQQQQQQQPSQPKASNTADWWVRSGRAVHDPKRFYLPSQLVGPGQSGPDAGGGNAFAVSYDQASLMALELRDPMGSTTRVLPNYRLMQAYGAVDDNGNRQCVRFDALGVPMATAVMGKPGEQVGDLMDLSSPEATTGEHPTTKVSYDIDAWADAGSPTWVHVEARMTHYFSPGGADSLRTQARTYFDGSGREAMSKQRVAPGPAPVPKPGGDGYITKVNPANGEPELELKHSAVRYAGTGRVVVDNKGNPVKQYEPFFTPTLAWDTDRSLAELGVSPILRYDPLGRLIRVDHPDGTFETTHFDAWSQTAESRNDTALDSAWYTDRTGPGATAADKSDAKKVAQVAGGWAYESLDPQGRAVRQSKSLFATTPDGLAATKVPQQLTTRLRLDITGATLSVHDPRGLEVQRNVPDQAGRVLVSVSPDAGPAWSLPNAEGAPLLEADGRGVVHRTHYDLLQRPTLTETRASPSDAWRTSELTVYGEQLKDAEAHNLRGEAALTFDDAGLAQAVAFDFVGNLLTSSRRLLQSPTDPPDWTQTAAALANSAAAAPPAPPTAAALAQVDGLLLPDSAALTATSTWNALGELIDQTTPDNSTTRHHYDEAGALRAVQLRHRGATDAAGKPKWSDAVNSITYNARGQRERVAYGNGTSTRTSYDRDTFRVTRIRTTDAQGVALQDLSFGYDPDGNILWRDDAAQQTLFFANQPVSASGDYVYDSLGRLIVAKGRERAVSAGLADLAWQPKTLGPSKPTASAVQRYTERYRYDAVGNLVNLQHIGPKGSGWQQAYTYAGQPSSGEGTPTSNQLSQVERGPVSQSFAYDGAGNMTALSTVQALQWNAEGMLGRALLHVSGTVDFRYDAGGMRVQKVVTHGGRVTETVTLGSWERSRTTSGTGTVLEAEELLAVSDGASVVLRVATTLASKGGAVPSTALKPRWRYELADQLGSRTVYVNGAGAVLGRREYLPYGRVAYESWSGPAPGGALLRHRFNGKPVDAETGLLDYGARLYAPWLGVWTAVDPVFDVGIGSYVYVRANPVTLVDPDGRDPKEAGMPPTDLPDQAGIATVPPATRPGGRAKARSTPIARELEDRQRPSISAPRPRPRRHQRSWTKIRALSIAAQQRGDIPQAIVLGIRSAVAHHSDPKAVGETLASEVLEKGLTAALGTAGGVLLLSASLQGDSSQPPTSEEGQVWIVDALDAIAEGVVAGTPGGTRRAVVAAHGRALTSSTRSLQHGGGAPKTGGAGVVRVGQAGEDAVRSVYNIGEKAKLTINGRGRIPDGLTPEVLSEVKNVKRLSFTRQLRDFSDHAKANGLRFDLYVRPDTKLSGPLLDAVKDKTINLRFIPQ